MSWQLAPNMRAGHSETTENKCSTQPTTAELKEELAAPSSQRAPVQPRPQVQLPVAASHLPPLLQLHRRRQSTPNHPGVQPGSGPRTRIRASLLNYYNQNNESAKLRDAGLMSSNWHLCRLTVSAGLSLASRAAQTPPADRVVLGALATRRRASAVRSEAPRGTGCNPPTPKTRHGHVTNPSCVVFSSLDGCFGLTGVAARSYEPRRTFARPCGRIAPPAVMAPTFPFTVRSVTSLFTD